MYICVNMSVYGRIHVSNFVLLLAMERDQPDYRKGTLGIGDDLELLLGRILGD